MAERFGTTEQTVYKWKHRDSVHDRSHTPHRLQTTLTPAQEAVAVVLRKTPLVSIDDLLAVVREFLNPDVSRSGLDRCLRRHGVGNLRDLQAKEPRPKHKAFKAYEPGYLHVDVKYLPQMADETSRRYLFVAIDRATRWVFIRIYKSKAAANARRFLRDLERACPIRIRTVLTDNVLCAEQNGDLVTRSRGIRATGHLEYGCPGGLRRQEIVSPIANTGYARRRPSPSLRRDPKSQAEGPNIIYEVAIMRLHGPLREGSFRLGSPLRRRGDRVRRI